MTTRTYPDANVLIAAYRAGHPSHVAATRVVLDPRRRFVACSVLALELVPHAVHYGRLREAEFYRRFLDGLVSETATVDERLVASAMEIAEATDASVGDSLHLAAAVSLGADESLTLERRTKPLYRETRVRVVRVDNAGGPSRAPIA